jgi:hypothetical protein
MTPGTFVGGEASSVVAHEGSYLRTAYLRPNSASDGTSLTKLRSMLVHETRAAYGEPDRRAHAHSVPASIPVPGRKTPSRLALRLRLPGATRIVAVRVDGRSPSRFESRTGTIELAKRGGIVRVVARTAAP